MNQVQLSRVDLNLLVVFEVVLHERHVGRAASRLALTPSAVSHSLKRLRDLLNDPLFLPTPKGVVPTARAAELAEPIGDILGRVRGVLASAEAFDPKQSTRRFTIGAAEHVAAVILPRLLGTLGKTAPRVDISVRQLLPPRGGSPSNKAWEPVLDDLEARSFDIAISPLAELPVRFVAHTLYEEDFVVATRKGHPFARRPTLESYCAMEHIVVSMTGDPHGVLDELLAARRRSRRVALTVPNFMQALAHVAETDLIAALPRRLVETYAARFGLTSSELPVPRARDPIRAIATKSALMDPGVAWLFGVLPAPAGSREGRGRRKRASLTTSEGL